MQDSSNFKIAAISLFFVLIVAINYWPVFLGRVPLATDDVTQFPPFRAYFYEASAHTPHGELGDSITEVYPWRKFAAEALRSGVMPLWNPRLFAGIPFQANFLSAIFYPLNWIFVVLPMPTAWSLSLMLKVFLSALFMWLFLREIGAADSGAIVGAIAFAFSGFMTAWLAWPRADSSIWLPLLCFQVHRLCRRPSARNAILLAGALAMPIFAGHPGIIARTLSLAALYGLWIVLTEHSRIYRHQLLWLSVAGALALALTAVQVAPSIEWLTHIFRTVEMPGFGIPLYQAIGFFSRDLSRQPNSAGVFVPEGAVYIGALSLLAAAFALFREEKKDVIFFAVVFAFGCGTAYGIYPILEFNQMLPMFSGLRFDEALLLADFALAILAGLGTSYLETFEWTRSKKNALLGSLMVLLVATTTFHHGAAVLSQMTARGVDWWRGPRSFRVLLVIGACLIALRLFQLLSRRQWTIVASILIAVDMLSYSYGRIPFNRAETIYPDVPLFRFLSQQQQPFRVISLNMATSANVEYVYSLSTAGGYEYMLKRMSSLAEGWLEEPANGYMLSFPSRGIVQSKNRILDLLNIRYLIATRFNESEPLMRSSPDRFRQVWSDGNASVFENLKVLPKVFLVPQTNAEVIPSDEGQLARLKESTFDPAQRVILPAVLDAELIDSGKPASPARQDMKYSEGLNWVRVQVAATMPSILVLSQIHYPGWRVYVDGKPAPLLRPDYALTGTMVAPGEHEIEFRFLPTTFMAGAIVSIISLILAVFAYLKFTINESD